MSRDRCRPEACTLLRVWPVHITRLASKNTGRARERAPVHRLLLLSLRSAPPGRELDLFMRERRRRVLQHPPRMRLAVALWGPRNRIGVGLRGGGVPAFVVLQTLMLPTLEAREPGGPVATRVLAVVPYNPPISSTPSPSHLSSKIKTYEGHLCAYTSWDTSPVHTRTVSTFSLPLF